MRPGLVRRDVLSEVMSGTYRQVKGPRAVLRRGPLQKRGSSGVFFNRFAVRPPSPRCELCSQA